MSRMQDNTPYRENELENRIDRFARGAEADERMILNYVHVLAQRGLRPSSRETIEQFIIKHMDELTPQLSW